MSHALEKKKKKRDHMPRHFFVLHMSHILICTGFKLQSVRIFLPALLITNPQKTQTTFRIKKGKDSRSFSFPETDTDSMLEKRDYTENVLGQTSERALDFRPGMKSVDFLSFFYEGSFVRT